MKKRRKKIDFTPFKLSECIVFLLFAILFASIFTYLTVVFAGEYAHVKDILKNGRLVEAEFKEVGKQYNSYGKPGVDGYDYCAVYCYYDDSGNYYEVQGAFEYYSPEEVIAKAPKTKYIYIDGKGRYRDGKESLPKYTAKGTGVIIVLIFFYALSAVGVIQLIRRIKLDKAKKAKRRSE